MKYIYYIKDEGVLYFSQSASKNVWFDWKHCAILGFLFGGDSSFFSLHNADIRYSSYISDKTKTTIKQYASVLSPITKDSFGVLNYDYSDYRSFLYNQGVVYEKSDSTLPLFFNELTERNCIFSFAKALVLQNMDEVTEQEWSSSGGTRLKIKTPYKKLTDSIIDIFEYAGLLKPDYSESASTHFTKDSYYIVFENFEGCLKENLCEWLLDQEQGFFADVPKIDDPRGNPEEVLPPSPQEKPYIEGYTFLQTDSNITYDGTRKQMPSVTVLPNPVPDTSHVRIEYRMLPSNTWVYGGSNNCPETNEFKPKYVGSYVLAAKLIPIGTAAEEYRTTYLYYSRVIEKREAVILPVSNQTPIPYDGNLHTLTNSIVENIASGEVIKPDVNYFKGSYRNTGSFPVFIDESIFDIGYYEGTRQPTWVSTKNNYNLTYRTGTVTIDSENIKDVSVPQETFNIPAKAGTEPGEISISETEHLYYYRIPFISSYYKKTCVINSVAFNVKTTSTIDCYIGIGFCPQSDITAVTWCYNNSWQSVQPGVNKINLETSYSVEDDEPRFLCFKITTHGSPVVLESVTLKDSNYINATLSDADNVEGTVVSEVPAISFYRNENGLNDKVIDYIDGLNHFYSNNIPIESQLSISSSGSYSRIGSVIYWYVKKEEIGYIGNTLNKIELKQLDPNAYACSIPDNTWLDYIPVYDNSDFLNENNGFTVKANDGIIYIDSSPFRKIGDGAYSYSEINESDPNKYSIYFVNDQGVNFNDENAKGFIFRFETTYLSPKTSIRSRLFENTDYSESYWNVISVDNGGTLNSLNDTLIPVNFRPTMKFYYNVPEGESEEQVPSSKKTVENWFPELFESEEEPPFQSILQTFEISGVSLDIQFEEKQFKLEGNSSITFTKSELNDNQYSNVRGYRLSFCAFAMNEDGADINIHFGTNTIPDHVCGSNLQGVYKNVALKLQPMESGSSFSCSINNESSVPVYISNICLIVYFVE